jgi:serine/threonine-protein kinase
MLDEGLADHRRAKSRRALLENAAAEDKGSSELGTLTRCLALADVPRILLRDADAETDPGPLVQPGSPEMKAIGAGTGRLQLLGEIARGGMGAVLKGRDLDLCRDLAVKVLLESHCGKPELVRRFVEEAQIGGQLQHPGIVPIYELGTFVDRRPYFAMKLVKGRTLSCLFDERTGPGHDLPRFLSIFEAVCQTVGYAHARGVIHRDLKPSNIMVGSFGEVQVMDWGLAKVLPQGGAADDASAGRAPERDTKIATARLEAGGDASLAGSVMGTPAYMAPEQARGEVDRLDERCDVFALGSILCEALTGAPAFTGRSSGELQRKASRGDLSEALDRLDRCGADPELVALARDCLAPELEDRPRHAGLVTARISAYQISVRERLRQAEIARAEEQARMQEATKRIVLERQRRHLTAALATLAVSVALAGAGGWAFLVKVRAARRAAAAQVVARALEQANLLRGQAQAAHAADPSLWTEAIAAAREARSMLAATLLDPVLRDRVEGLIDDLQREQDLVARRASDLARDRNFLARLEAIRLERGEYGDPSQKGAAKRADADYAAAFAAYGVELEQLEPAPAGRILSKHSQALDLAFFLDDWALLRMDSGSASRSQRIFAVASEIDPDPWRAELRRQAEKRAARALRTLAADEKALASRPARSLFLLGRLLWGSHFPTEDDLNLAERVIKLAWRRQPDDFWICYELGVICRNQTDALRFSTAAVSLRPKDAWARATLAQAYLPFEGIGPRLAWSHSSPNSSVIYAWEHTRRRRILRAPPSHAQETLVAGPEWTVESRALDEHSLEQSEREYREAIQLKPGDGDLHWELAELLVRREGRLDAALQEYRQASRLRPEEATIHLSAACALALKGKRELAVAEAQEAIRLDPKDECPHILLASIHQTLGRTSQAVQEFTRAFLIRGGDQLLAEFLHATGTPAQEFAAYREAVRANPAGASLRADFARELLRHGKVEEAVAEYRAEVELLRAAAQTGENDPSRQRELTSACDRLSGMLVRIGALEEALPLAREAALLQPRVAYYLDSLAQLHLERGELKEALTITHQANRLQDKPGPQPDARRRQIERLSALDAQLEAILSGNALPPGAQDRLDLAELCRVKRRFADALRCYCEAFQAEPALADDLKSLHRLHAAIAAAQAGTSPIPVGAEPAAEANRAGWRARSLEWLSAEAKSCARLIASGQSSDQVLARTGLELMLHHRDLACVRDESRLNALLESERNAWRSLWAGVAALHAPTEKF